MDLLYEYFIRADFDCLFRCVIFIPNVAELVLNNSFPDYIVENYIVNNRLQQLISHLLSRLLKILLLD